MLNQVFVASGYEIKNYLCQTSQFLEEKKHLNFLIEVYYIDLQKNNFKHRYEIDLNQYIYDSKIVQDYPVEHHLNELNKLIEKLVKLFEQKIRKNY